MNRHVGVNAPWRRSVRCPPPPPVAVGWPAQSTADSARGTFDQAIDVNPPPPPWSLKATAVNARGLSLILHLKH
eukprot:4904669-Amphidinium_carterae.4